MSAWLHVSLAGMPRWGWLLVVGLTAIEMALGKSTDPRFRSVADSSRNLLGLVLGSIPIGGPLLVRALQAIYVVPKAPEGSLPLPPDKP